MCIIGEGVVCVALHQRVTAEGLLDWEWLLLKLDHAVLLFCGEVALFEVEREVVHSDEGRSQLLRGTGGGGCRVVQLMHQARGEGSERYHFFVLQGHALHMLKALRHVGQNGFAHLWTAGHQAPELLLVELEEMGRLGGLEIHATGNVCQKRQLAEGVPALHLVERAFVVGMEDANLAFKQNPEKTRGVALVREKLARIEVEVCHSLYAMELFVLERREDGDVAKLREQLWSYCFDHLVLDD